MVYAQRTASGEDAKAQRKRAGAWLQSLRKKAGLTQREVATKVGFDYYTFVSQLEGGDGRIPPDKIIAYAGALGVDHREFAKSLLQYYDPHFYAALFGGGGK